VVAYAEWTPAVKWRSRLCRLCLPHFFHGVADNAAKGGGSGRRSSRSRFPVLRSGPGWL